MNKKLLAPLFIVFFVAVIFIKNPEFTSSYVKNGLDLCITTIIPSLFPLMVISEILCRFGFTDMLGRLLKAVRNPFLISGKALSAVLMGLLFGFPIGTRALVALYDGEEISREEVEGCAGFCGSPSLGFLVNVVGLNLFSSKGFGWFMYFSAVTSAIISGIIFKKKENGTALFVPAARERKGFAEILTLSLSSSVIAIITLCGYVVFFSCVVGCVSGEFSSDIIGGLIAAVTELTAGVRLGAELCGHMGSALCGFAIGWSGISVHCQAMALLSSRVDSYSLYFKQKLFQGVLCAILALVFSLVFRITPCISLPTATPALPDGYLAFVFFLFFLSLILIKQKSRST